MTSDTYRVIDPIRNHLRDDIDEEELRNNKYLIAASYYSSISSSKAGNVDTSMYIFSRLEKYLNEDGKRELINEIASHGNEKLWNKIRTSRSDLIPYLTRESWLRMLGWNTPILTQESMEVLGRKTYGVWEGPSTDSDWDIVRDGMK